MLERHGIRFGFLGFNAIGETPRAAPGQPGALSVRMPPRTGPLDRADLARVLGAVRRLDERVDVVVVMPHWGTQYTHRAGAGPAPRRAATGRRRRRPGRRRAPALGAGNRALPRRHHRLHALGNFVFDMDFMQETMEGVALTATFRGDRLRRVELTPYRLDDRFAPRLVHGAAARSILAQAR